MQYFLKMTLGQMIIVAKYFTSLEDFFSFFLWHNKLIKIGAMETHVFSDKIWIYYQQKYRKPEKMELV